MIFFCILTTCHPLPHSTQGTRPSCLPCTDIELRSVVFAVGGYITDLLYDIPLKGESMQATAQKKDTHVILFSV